MSTLPLIYPQTTDLLGQGQGLTYIFGPIVPTIAP